MVFIKYGKVCSQVHSKRLRLFPIPSGGLEILLMAKLTISDEKCLYLAHLRTLIERSYQVAEKEEDDLHEQEEDICDDNEDDTITVSYRITSTIYKINNCKSSNTVT